MSTSFLAIHVQPQLGAANRLPEGDVDLIFQIAARLRTCFRLCAKAAASSAEHPRKDVAKTSAAATRARARKIRKIEATEIDGHALGAATGAESTGRAAKAARAKASAAGVGFGGGRINVVGVKAELVVYLALLEIAENVVGLGEFLESLLRLLVTGIDVGMMLAR